MNHKAFIYIFFLFISFQTLAQDWAPIEKENKEKADNFFKNEEFDKALPLYSQLLSIHGRDVDLNLKYAICVIELNKDLKEAKKYLDYVKHVNPDNPLVYYYLGIVLHLQYKFTNAIAYYQKFMELAPGRLVKKYDPEQKIRMCRNGEELINFVSQLIVLENKTVKKDNFWYSYRLDNFGGRLIVTPNDFRSKGDIKAGYKGLTFMWNNKLAFFSSHGETKKGNLDIYQATLSDNGQWIIERLPPPVNTLYDDEYPYLAPDGKTLYFASKGQNSMGGYDIFVTVYDSARNVWSKPVNLDFPINTPYDDILYVTDKDNKYAYFASQRSTDRNHINVYKILVDKNPRRRKTKGLEDIYEQAKLKVTPIAENDEELKNAAENEQLAESKSEERDTVSESAYNNMFKPINADSMLLADLNKQIDNDLQVINSEEEKLKKTLAFLQKQVEAKGRVRKEVRSKIKSYLSESGDKNPNELKNYVDEYSSAVNDELAAIDLYNNVREKYDNFESGVDKIRKEYEDLRNIQNKRQLYLSLEKERKKFSTLNYSSNFDFDTEKDFLSAKKADYNEQLAEIQQKISKLENDIRETKKEINSKKSQIEEEENDDVKVNLKNEIDQLETYLSELKKDIREEKAKEIEIKQSMAQVEKKFEIINSADVSNVNSSDLNNGEISNIVDNNDKLTKDFESFISAKKQEPANEYNDIYAFVNSTMSEDFGQDVKEKADNVYKSAVLANEPAEEVTQNENEVLAQNNARQNEVKTQDNSREDTSQINDEVKTQNAGAGKQENESNSEVSGQKEFADNESQDSTNGSLQNEEIITGADTTKNYNTAQNDTALNITPKDVENLLAEKNIEQKNTSSRNYIEKDTPENISKEVNNLPQVAEILPEINVDSSDNENVKKEKLLAASEVVRNKMENEKLQLAALQSSMDNGSIIAEKDKAKQKISYLKKQIKADSLLLSQINKQLVDREYVGGEAVEKSMKFTTEFIKQNVETTTELSDAEKEYFANKITKIDSLFENSAESDKEKIKVLQAKTTVDDLLYYRFLSKIDSTEQDINKSGKAKYLVSNAKLMYSLAMKIEKDAGKEKDGAGKQNLLMSANNLKEAAVKNLILADKILKNKSDSSKLELPVYSPDNQDKEELKNSIVTVESAKNKTVYLRKKLKDLTNELMNDSLATKSKVKKLTKEITKLNKQYVANSVNILNADSNLYSINEKYITSLSSKYPPGDVEKFTTFKNYSEKFYNKAQSYRLKAIQEKDVATKMQLLDKANENYEKAVRYQNMALGMILFGNENVDNINTLETTVNSPLLLANEISKQEVNLDVDKKTIVKRDFSPEQKDAWYYVEDNEKELKGMFKTLSDAENMIAKNEYDIKHSKNPDRIETAKKDLQYLEKTRKTIIDDIAGLVTENSKAKKTILSKKIEELKQNNNIPEDRLQVAELLESEADDYDKKAEEILTGKIKKVTDDRIKAKLVSIAKQYSDKAANLRFEAIQVLKTKNGLPDDKILAIVNKKPENETINNLTQGLEADKVIAMYQKPRETGGTNTLVKANLPENSILLNDDFVLTNVPQSMQAGQSYPVSVTLDTTLYSSLAKLKVYFPGYVNVRIVSLPYGADTLITDTSVSMVWIKFFGNKQQNLLLSVKPNNVFAYNDTIKVEFSYLANNKIRRIEKKIPVRFEPAAVAMNEENSANENTSYIAANNVQPETNDVQQNELLQNKSSNEVNGNVDSTSQKQNLVTVGNYIDTTNNNINNANVESNLISKYNTSVNESRSSSNKVTKNNVGNASNVDNNLISKSNAITNKDNNNSNRIINNNTSSKLNVENNSISKSNTVSNSKEINNTSMGVAIKNASTVSSSNNEPFVVLNKSYYSKENPIPINPLLPDGIVYKIQIGAYFKLVPDTTFKVRPVSAEKQKGSRYYKYLFGEFKTFDAAIEGLRRIRAIGYPEAFIIAYKDGKRVPVYVARNAQYASPSYNELASAEVNAVKTGTSVNNTKQTSVNQGTPLPTDKELYTVQIGVFKRKPNPAFFAAFDNILYEETPYGFTRYFTGIFNSYQEAIVARNAARKKGIKDAFIVKYSNGKRMLQPASVTQQLASAGQTQRQTQSQTQEAGLQISDTTGLFFTVQIGAFKGNVSLEELLKGISSVRGKDVGFIKSNGYTVFIAGKFNTYKKARDLMLILRNEGIKDAFVIAVQNGKKIPVQEAIRVLKTQGR